MLNREGEDALQRALRVLEADPHASTQTRIETLIQMGDWYQIKKSPREALPHYQRASQLIRTAPSLSGSAATALDFPVRVSYPTPQIVANVLALPPEETQSHYVQIEFTVAADGSVSDARVVDHDTRDRYARRNSRRHARCALSAEVRRRPGGRDAWNGLSRGLLDGQVAGMTRMLGFAATALAAYVVLAGL